jgi:hypothetical protein
MEPIRAIFATNVESNKKKRIIENAFLQPAVKNTVKDPKSSLTGSHRRAVGKYSKSPDFPWHYDTRHKYIQSWI